VASLSMIADHLEVQAPQTVRQLAAAATTSAVRDAVLAGYVEADRDDAITAYPPRTLADLPVVHESMSRDYKVMLRRVPEGLVEHRVAWGGTGLLVLLWTPGAATCP
jgi:hypothetical protein